MWFIEEVLSCVWKLSHIRSICVLEQAADKSSGRNDQQTMIHMKGSAAEQDIAV